MSQVYYSTFQSPVGPLLLAGSKAGLLLVSFASGNRPRNVDPEWRPDTTAFLEVVQQLQSYFAGQRKNFDLALILQGTDFQKRVWTALRTIPAGQTTSYGAIAQTLGTAGASRAVGAANGANPIAIVVPCHRVIGSNGSLTGYGGGLDRKTWLIDHERRWRIEPQASLF